MQNTSLFNQNTATNYTSNHFILPAFDKTLQKFSTCVVVIFYIKFVLKVLYINYMIVPYLYMNKQSGFYRNPVEV